MKFRSKRLLLVMILVATIIFGYKVSATTFKTRIHIDYPYTNQTIKDILNFQGWIISEDKDAKINIYIDNKQVAANNIERYRRDDVLREIKGYGGESTNPTPGYRGSVNVSNLKNGHHKFKVEAISATGEVLESVTNSFEIKDFEGIIYIDSPTTDEKKKNTLNYFGWVMSEDPNATVEIYIDDIKQDSVERYKREDVLKTIISYGGRKTNQLPGYRGSVDLSGLKDGNHTLKVHLISSLGVIIKEEKRNFKVKKYDSRIHIDYPYLSQKVKGTLNFQGWIMSENKDASVNIYIDDTKIDANNIERYRREDVLREIKGYGGELSNPNPGYRGSINLSNLKDGTHKFKVEVISNTKEILETSTNNFTIKSYSGDLYIDSPKVDEKKKNSLNYFGWVMSEDPNATVEIYIDDILQDNPERYKREDVLKAITNYGGRKTNQLPGYRGNIDISNLKDGYHVFKVRLLSALGVVIKEEKRNFIIKRYESRIHIDYPYISQTIKGTLNFQGWIMSEYKDANINIYIDDEKVDSNTIERYMRADVLREIKDYGGEATNPTPGYRGSINLSNLKQGTHKFRVDVISNTGGILESSTNEFYLKDYTGEIYIDAVINSPIKKDTSYFGWAMSDDSNATIEIYIDDIKQDNVERYKREDVLKTITNYGGRKTNTLPGFRYNIEIDKLLEGKHVLTTKLISSNKKVIKEIKKVINIKKYDTDMYIDFPTNDTAQKESIDIKGWVMSEDENGTLELYIDGKQVDPSKIVRYERSDVIRKVKGYGGIEKNPTPGYSATIDTTGIKDGTHTLLVKYVSSENSSVYESRSTKFKVKKYDGTMYIDSPVLNHFSSSSINIRGWELSDDDSSYVKVFIDDTDMNISLTRIERQDVLNKYKNEYGGKSLNPTPGFIGKIDLSNISAGTHTLTFKVYSRYQEVITSYKNSICVKMCNPTYYNQADPRWANTTYGLSSMKSTGCSPTSMAMAFSTILSKTVLPTDVANYLYYNTNQFNRMMKGTSGLGIIYAANNFRIKYTPLTSKQMLSEALSSGKQVYAAMGNGRFATRFYNHAIILISNNNGTTIAYDPLRANNNGSVSIDQIWNEQSKDPDDYQGGSNFYALEGYYQR